MSATVGNGQQQEAAAAVAASSRPQETPSRVSGGELAEQNNNNNNNPQASKMTSLSHASDSKTISAHDSMSKPGGGSGGCGGGGGHMRKRSSVQSNLSRHSNGGGHSLSSSTTNTSNEDIDQPAAAAPRMSNAEYEHVRNTTLLFFLDRLYLASQEGKEARTLHDLSCLFGTREFTKEMRQIVGASRNGLKKFLQSYPSLFQIEGDKVYLTQLKQDTQVAQRDYNREAVEYFKAKLLQFGTSLVPIKNLFGYRSQASQEVRHVSGKSTRDFKQFLALNEDVFEILADEHVVLKTALAELESQGQTSISLQQSLAPLPADDAIVMDPYLNKQFAHLVEECMKKMAAAPSSSLSPSPACEAVSTTTSDLEQDSSPPGLVRVTLEQLYEQIQKQCQNELFLKMVKTLDDLRVFLRMHPKLFKRSRCDGSESGHQQEFVSLLSENERREIEAATYPNLQRQHSALTTTTTTTTTMGPASLVVSNKSQVSRQESQQQVGDQAHFSSLPPQTRAANRTAQESPAARQVTAAATAKKLPQDRTANTLQQAKQQQAQKTQDQQPLSRQMSCPGQEAGKQPFDGRQSSSSWSSHKNQNQNQSQQLRANAPPFVPPSRESSRSHPPEYAANLSNSNNSPSLGRQNSALVAGAYGYRPELPRTQQNGGLTHRPAAVQRSHSNLNQSATTTYKHHQAAASQRRPPIQNLAPIDHRSAIRNYLLSDNGSNQHMSWTSPSAGGARSMVAGQNQNQNQAPAHHLQPPPPPPPPPSADEMRARTVDMVREASNIITRIMTTTDAVAFDCKGYNLGFDGQITLIQFGYLPRVRQVDPIQLANSMAAHRQHSVGAQEPQADFETLLKPEVCVFDLITNPELAYCLKPLLESDKIVKIVHDVRNKSNALYVQFKIILNNVFDTQVANLVIQQQDTGKPAYKSRYISMSKLCEIYGGDELMRYRNLIKLKTSRAAQTTSAAAAAAALATSTNPASASSSSSSKDVNYWRARPLTKPMIFEATMDVYCLVGGIYQNLKAKIKPEYEPLFDQLNLEGVLARIRPDEIRSAKKERKIDLEVIDLKRKLYSDTLGPVVLSNREIRLLRHIDLTDEVRAKIQQCKKVAKKLERLDMKAAMLLEAKQAASLDGPQLSSLSSNGTGGGDGGGDNTGELIRHLSRQSSGSTTNQSIGQRDAERSLEAGELQLKSITFKLDELNATGMMMDSSMFDELKDKMIESSSLLESLEDDDDDDVNEQAAVTVASLEAARLSLSGPHSHQGSTGGDCCHCQCHTSGSGSNHSSHTSDDLTTERTSEVQPRVAIEANNMPAAAQQHKESAASANERAEQEQNESDLKSKGDSEEIVKSPISPGVEDLQQQKEGPTTTTTTTNNDHSIASDDSKSSTGCDMAVQCDLLS